MVNNRAKRIYIPILLLFSGVLISIFTFRIRIKENPTKSFKVYVKQWENQNFKGMYDMLSNKTTASLDEQHFIDRYTAIYKGIEAENIKIQIGEGKKVKEDGVDNMKIPFSISMKTAAGDLNLSGYEASFIKEKVDGKSQWRLIWNEKLIYPNMEPGDKVRMKTLYAKRGEICDRNGKMLAENDYITSIGIHPSKFVLNKDANIAQMANILDIKPSVIESKLKANTNPDYFVPIINISSDKVEKIAEVKKIAGVVARKVEGRVYPGGEAFGSLIGYIGEITAEELKKLGDGYDSRSLIGKAGLEQVYEKRLKGENGAEIYISRKIDEEDEQRITIAKKEPVDGEVIRLSVESNLQKKIYNEMNGDAGACAAINPKSGEIMALVSSPSYDPNVVTTYVPNSQRLAWKNSNKNPFLNRFKSLYSPGSTFKLITAAIGLDKGVIQADKPLNIQGSRWQADKSWGGYMVSRIVDPKRPVNLRDAFAYSDNIYFAKTVLEIGKEEFIKGCSNFGFGEEMPIEYPIEKSRISNSNDIKNDILLADSGYGQGEILISPLHTALIYSSIVNEGNIMVPKLQITSKEKADKVWKGNVVSDENIKLLSYSLSEVVENLSRTGTNAKVKGIALAGKTGTAELKKTKDDKESEQNGWYVCMNTDNPKIVTAMVIEDVKNRGGSHYVVPKVRNIMEYYFNQVK